MSNYTKFVPEKDLLLAETILDRYNTKLHCSACHKKWTNDGTTFRRDSGGRRGSLFYRKFRCKGKDLGCNANHPVAEFMAIALKDLGPAIIADLRSELNIPDGPQPLLPIRKFHPRTQESPSVLQVPSTPESSKKRSNINSPTGFTPDSKRQTHNVRTSINVRSPTVIASLGELQIQLFIAEEKVRLLEVEVKSKQKIIDRLIKLQSIFH